MHTKERLEQLGREQLIAMLMFLLAITKKTRPRIYRQAERIGGLTKGKKGKGTYSLSCMLKNPHPAGAKYLYSTIKRGKVKVRSLAQHRLLEGRGLGHTHIYRYKRRLLRIRVNE